MMVLLIVMTGLMAGIYFAFSVFIMKSLAGLPPLQGAQVMNKINDVIVNTLFLPLFFVSTLWFAGLIVWSIADWQTGRSWLHMAAASLYILGMFAVTAFGNVPLNNQLKALEQEPKELADFWMEYQNRWARLNHLRSLSCIAATALLVIAYS